LNKNEECGYSTIISVIMTLVMSIIVLSTLVGCSPLDVLNAVTPSDQQRRIADIPYGTKPRQQLDVYIPDDRQNNRDVVVFYYGGSWRNGEKEQYRFVADALTENGVVVVIPDFRLYPQADWKEMLADAAAANQWAIENIKQYGGNPQRVFLQGHSSGAHMAAMVALDDKLRQRAGSVTTPCGLIGLAGPYDFLPIQSREVKQVFSSANGQLSVTQPITFVSAGDPSAFLLSGADDGAVYPSNSINLGNALISNGVNAQVKIYPDIGHAGVVASLAPLFRSRADTLADIMHFINTTQCNSS
jgi:acetyl esterase/lipase